MNSTAIAAYAKGAWAAVGPLIGVLVGAWLAKSSDRKKWLSENRKQECQELLGAITAAAMAILSNLGMTDDVDQFTAYLKSIEVFHTRIFIAKEVEREKLEERWTYAVHDYGRMWGKEKFDIALEEIRAKIIAMAMRQP